MAGSSSVSCTLTYCANVHADLPYKYVYDPPEGTPKTNIRMEDRQAVIHDLRGTPFEKEANLDDNGFQYVKHASQEKTFEDQDLIKANYYKEIEEMLLKTLPGAKRVYIWDNTIRRLAEQPVHMDFGTARGPARTVHIDQTYEASIGRAKRYFDKETADRLLSSRFRIVNVWRPIENPVAHKPLAVADWKSVDPKEDYLFTRRIYPDFEGSAFNVRYNPNHKFYFLSSQKPDEILLIKIYDSQDDGKTARATAHSAFEDPHANPNDPQRQSIEVRCMIFDAE